MEDIKQSIIQEVLEEPIPWMKNLTLKEVTSQKAFNAPAIQTKFIRHHY